MNGINYPRHFAILGCMAALWILFTSALLTLLLELERLRIVGSNLGLYVFALAGASHAISLVAALSGRVSLAKRAIFIVAAAALSTAVPLIAIAAGERLSLRGWGGYPEFVIASAAGALTYALLVKVLLLRGLSLRALLLAAFLCPVATLITVKSDEYLSVLRHSDWITVTWWIAFSTSLFLAHGRGMAANKRLQGTPASGQP
jgi:hypothetical protein